MRPQPVACLALPPVFHRGQEPGCGYQACCEPQMCCLHGLPSQPDMPVLDKSQLEATLYNSNCAQPALISASLHQNQQLQRCWDMESSMQCLPPASPVPVIGPIQLNCSRRSASQPQAANSQPRSQSKSYRSYRQHHREVLPDSQAQLSAGRGRPGPCQGKMLTNASLQLQLSHTVVDRDVMTEGSWEERCRVGETCGQTAAVECIELLGQEKRKRSPVQLQHQLQVSAEMRKDQQRMRPPLMLRDHRDSRVRDYVIVLVYTSQKAIGKGEKGKNNTMNQGWDPIKKNKLIKGFIICNELTSINHILIA